ncbi:MAG: 30S ribosomal protein S5 [Planctomycetota bacterium]
MAKDRDRDRGERVSDGLEDRLIKVRRSSTTVKGGRRFTFNALVVIGDGKGRVAFGYGKANEVPPAVEKATKEARDLVQRRRPVQLRGDTIPHRIVGRYGSSRVILVPAGAGTGVKAGASVRAVLEVAGVRNILTKVHGSTNPINLIKATLDGLENLRSRESVARLRGVAL